LSSAPASAQRLPLKALGNQDVVADMTFGRIGREAKIGKTYAYHPLCPKLPVERAPRPVKRNLEIGLLPKRVKALQRFR
jgi:hypothetical protein